MPKTNKKDESALDAQFVTTEYHSIGNNKWLAENPAKLVSKSDTVIVLEHMVKGEPVQSNYDAHTGHLISPYYKITAKSLAQIRSEGLN